MAEIEVSANASHRTDVYVELRLSTTKGSKLAMTLGITDRATEAQVDEVITLCRQKFEAMCEDHGRLDEFKGLSE